MQKNQTLFERTLGRLLTIEGGYTNDPDDSGGPTNRGVTQSEYFKWQREHSHIYNVKKNGYKSIRDISRPEDHGLFGGFLVRKRKTYSDTASW